MPETITDPTAQGVDTAPPSDALIRDVPVAVPAWPVAPPPGFQVEPPVQQTVEPVVTATTPEIPVAPPSWIDSVGAPVAPQYQAPPQYQPPPQPYQPPQPPPQDYTAPPAAVGGMDANDRALYELVHQPEAWVRGMTRTEVQNSVAPVIGQVQEATAQMHNYIKTQADASEHAAKNNVKMLYSDVINQDETYNSNPQVKAEVDRTIQNMLGNSIAASRNGDFGDVSRMARMTPLEAKATLNAIKTVHGELGTQTLAPQVGTAVVERPTAAAPGPSVSLDADEEAAIAWRERVDPTFRGRYIEAKKVALQRGDWQF